MEQIIFYLIKDLKMFQLIKITCTAIKQVENGKKKEEKKKF